MKNQKQNARNTKAVRETLLNSRHGKAIQRAADRWNGAGKILALLARSGAVVTGTPATGILSQKYVL